MNGCKLTHSRAVEGDVLDGGDYNMNEERLEFAVPTNVPQTELVSASLDAMTIMEGSECWGKV